jgi:hypothetical protein
VAIIPLGNWRSWLLNDSDASFLRETPFKAREDKGSRDVRDQGEEHSTREVKGVRKRKRQGDIIIRGSASKI